MVRNVTSFLEAQVTCRAVHFAVNAAQSSGFQSAGRSFCRNSRTPSAWDREVTNIKHTLNPRAQILGIECKETVDVSAAKVPSVDPPSGSAVWPHQQDLGVHPRRKAAQVPQAHAPSHVTSVASRATSGNTASSAVTECKFHRSQCCSQNCVMHGNASRCTRYALRSGGRINCNFKPDLFQKKYV